MKLIIQIPCYNEELALPKTLAELPREIPGVDSVEWLVVDDGSTDRTSEVAYEHGVDHIVRHTTNKGLADAFQTGLNACLQLGADIIVNTDGDNQYPSKYIHALVDPILQGKADIVIADRQVDKIEHFSPVKKLLQKLGSATVRYVSGTQVPDAPSGFRAMNREAAMRFNILTDYTYTLETVIQAGKKNLTIAHIPIMTNPALRKSRLMRNSMQYIMRSAKTILRLFILYEPLRSFLYISAVFFAGGLGLLIRYMILVLLGEAGRGSHIQSVIIGASAVVIGFLIMLIGLLSDIVATNRRLIEETLYYLKRQHFQGECPNGDFNIYSRLEEIKKKKSKHNPEAHE
ncbi:MAG: glycosyltransferase family 2 protein [Nitrospirota bacterium]